MTVQTQILSGPQEATRESETKVHFQTWVSLWKCTGASSYNEARDTGPNARFLLFWDPLVALREQKAKLGMVVIHP